MLQLAWRARPLRPWNLLRSARSVSSVAPPLIRIQNGTFYENYPTSDDAVQGHNPPLFPDFNFTLPSRSTPTKDGRLTPQTWAVVGSAGRTQMLDVLRGQYICTPPTARSYPYLLTDEVAQKDPRLRFAGNAIQYIGFSGEGSGAIGGTRGAYLSARYESLREETDWSVRQYLKGQTSLNPLESEQDGKVHDEQLLTQIISELRLEELLDMPVANLSNGQTRRTRIAKALLSKPELLLLDDPFMGLDPATVRSISSLLQRLAAKSDPRLVLALRPQDPLPDWITHIMVLGNSNRVLLQAPRAEAEKVFSVWKKFGDYEKPSAKEDPWVHQTYEQAKEFIDAGHLDRQLIWDMRLAPLHGRGRVTVVPPSYAPKGGEPLIEMDGVRVQYGEKCVLGGWTQSVKGEGKDGLHWKVRRGQRWAVLGANGSGKTTLLSLITSDHPQTYALPIRLFGRSRLPEPGRPGLSIFELQSRLGHSSPEIHAFFPRQLTIRQAIESAFAETFLAKPVLNHERDLDVSAILRFFRAELDPDAASSLTQKPVKVTTPRDIFPTLVKSDTDFYNPDHGVEYADTICFGELNTAQQRLILFLRALVHRPDIVILDEAFSGMPASVRDKCLNFIEHGEFVLKRVVKVLPAPPDARFRGLTDDQALVMISHVREEIPRCVRYFMRLPSDAGEQLDFRIGALQPQNTLSDPNVWDSAWAPDFGPQAVPATADQVPEGELVKEDFETYEWYSI
ncbi:ABC transporter [Aspergillus sclerotioniger CBS 115572]|uniref:ABC transporter n=1 Tax=Aspergillus sclerotioniger CBS 115572 TaxID=1450535 RepID=A0A317X3N0_9EURO|nr:ABC transporter [Aspergillus sclerotioniger CBS 115572]PWY91578.1 ABC transporter [Aspergillus sclerotioniger CBS 115572]